MIGFDKHSQPPPARSSYRLLAAALVTALALVLFEALQSVRGPAWAGLTPAVCRDLSLAWLIYTAVLFIPAQLVQRIFSSAWGAITFVMLFVLLWYGAAQAARATPNPTPIYLPWAFGLFAAFTSVLAAVRPRLTALTLASVLAGLVALFAANSAFLFHEYRTSFATSIAIAWLSFATATLVCVGALRPHGARGLLLSGLASLLFLGIPPIASVGFHHLNQPRIPDARPNLLLITADALRADACSTYGGPVPTPNLTRLADQGALFTRFFSLAPWTVPSMTAMFTSKYPPDMTAEATPAQWDAEMFQYWIDRDQRLLAERLRAKGYRTAAFVGNPALSRRDGILRGFQSTRHWLHLTPQRKGVFAASPLLHSLAHRVAPQWARLRPIDASRTITRYGDAFLKRNAREPFFLWLHYMDPHDPYCPPSAYRDDELDSWCFTVGDTQWPGQALDEDGYMHLPEPDRADVRKLYEGEVAYLDACIGRVLDSLERNGLDGRTIVCFTSDHGEQFWEHGRYGHGTSVYNPDVKVPLVIAGPAIEPQRITEPVSAIDVMPTLTDAVGATIGKRWQGVSLLPRLEGGTADPTSPVRIGATSHRHRPEPFHAIVDGDYKLVRGMASGDIQLFNLKKDPREQNNIAHASGIVDRLLPQLLNGKEEETEVGEDPGPAPENTQTELQEALQSLGYVQ